MHVSYGTTLEWPSRGVYWSVSNMYLEGDVVLGQELQRLLHYYHDSRQIL